VSSSIAIITKQTDVSALVRAVKAGALGVRVESGDDTERVLSGLRDEVGLKAVFCDLDAIDATLEVLGPKRTRVFALSPGVQEGALETCLKDPRLGGLIAVTNGIVRSWEITFLARRIAASNEASPHMGELLAWGSATLAWQPRTTKQQRQIVERIEGMCVRMGVDRRNAMAVSTAAHELTMNAMYDAPVDERGQPKYALDRRAQLELLEHEVPTLRFTLAADYLALDVTDPHGRLPRTRFFEGVLRGHRNMMGISTELDTSHGGAGLGLHTLYSSGAILRAELVPMRLTHVSWVLDRTVSRRDQRAMSRSLYFLPSTPRG
jgi:hypothetical protein